MADPLLVYARPEEVAELAQLRRRELDVLSERMARVASEGRARPWAGAASAFVSVGLGALIAGVPLLSSTSSWDGWVVPSYAAAVGMSFVLACICWLAARAVRFERADSVAAIKNDLDRLLDAYEVEAPADGGAQLPGVTSDLAKLLQPVRREARTNRQLIQQVIDGGRYWRLSDPTPEAKAWKKHRGFIEGDPALETLFESGEAARQEVERVLTVRSLRMFRGGKVRADDRLQDAVKTLTALEEGVARLGAPG